MKKKTKVADLPVSARKAKNIRGGISSEPVYRLPSLSTNKLEGIPTNLVKGVGK